VSALAKKDAPPDQHGMIDVMLIKLDDAISLTKKQHHVQLHKT
jgi:hypothetical protein